MTDKVTKQKRSEIMRAVKSKNTKPEVKLRKIIFGMGYRYSLHRKDLPGKPDIVLPGRQPIIFFHGCFWHGHNCAHGRRLPQTHRAYWINKISGNKLRDKRHVKQLSRDHWRVLVVWECQLQNEAVLRRKIATFFKTAERKRSSAPSINIQ
jgi:DNA mismatch endonuclease (patch repair protein)